MLTRITLRDFAIFQALELEPGAGMNVFTGETGAGKSLVVTALGLVLGDRATRGTVRAGAARADLAVEFTLEAAPGARRWLAERDLDQEDTCLLRRVITREGRSRAYINGVPMPLQAVRELGEQLVDIQGQHAHQALLRPGMQRRLLDEFAGHDTLLEEAGARYAQWRRLHDRLQDTDRRAGEIRDRKALLGFQIRELETLGLRAGEYAELDAEQTRLANAESVREQTWEAAQALYDADRDTLYERLAHIASGLREAATSHPALGDSAEVAEGLAIQAQELAAALRQYAETLESDPERLAQVDERLRAIHDLARKYAVEPEALPELHHRLKRELAELESPEYDVDTLRTALREAEERLDETCERLSRARRAAAQRLAEQAAGHLAALGMPETELEIRVTPRGPEGRGPQGWDEVRMYIRTNPGQPPGPLETVASGGELSRISLAVRLAAVDALPLPTLVFDEVDTGIGGAVAEAVGQRLKQLAGSRQVLCVTHLPQVAAQGDHHFRVRKEKAEQGVATRVEHLDPDGRVQEIARMLGGRRVTQRALEHAREMLGR